MLVLTTDREGKKDGQSGILSSVFPQYHFRHSIISQLRVWRREKITWKKNSFEFHVVVTTSTPLSSPNADEMLRVMISRGFSCWIFVYILIFFSDYIIIKFFRSVEHFFLSSLPVLFRSHPCDSSALRRSFIHMQPRTPHYISERRERAAAEAENIQQRRGKKRDSERKKDFKTWIRW